MRMSALSFVELILVCLGLTLMVTVKSQSVVELVAGDGITGDGFGTSVAISTNGIVAIAAPFHNSEQGSVYLFDCRSSSASQDCSFLTQLVAADGESGHSFGESIALADHFGSLLLVVGAPDYIGNEFGPGMAYVFDCSNLTSCVQVAKLMDPNGSNGELFGFSVSASNGLVLIGASGFNGAQGTAFLYDCTNLQNCYLASRLVASDAQRADYFGSAVSIFENLLVIGAYYKNGRQGTAYVFTCVLPTACFQTAKLVANDAAQGDAFGASVSVSQRLVVIGAPEKSRNVTEMLAMKISPNAEKIRVQTGAAYVFDCGDPAACPQVAKLTAAEPGQYSKFGFSVSVSNNLVAVGAVDESIDASKGKKRETEEKEKEKEKEREREGAGYLFDCSDRSSCELKDRFVGGDITPFARFGFAASIQGEKVVFGASGQNADTGAAYLFDF